MIAYVYAFGDIIDLSFSISYKSAISKSKFECISCMNHKNHSTQLYFDKVFFVFKITQVARVSIFINFKR